MNGKLKSIGLPDLNVKDVSKITIEQGYISIENGSGYIGTYSFDCFKEGSSNSYIFEKPFAPEVE